MVLLVKKSIVSSDSDIIRSLMFANRVYLSVGGLTEIFKMQLKLRELEPIIVWLAYPPNPLVISHSFSIPSPKLLKVPYP